MTKHIFAFIFLICIIPTAHAQDTSYVPALMTKRHLNCADIQLTTISIIPALYMANKMDTVNDIIAFYKSNCSIELPIQSLAILYAIQQRTFNEQLSKGTHYNNFTDAVIADTAYFNREIITVLHQYQYTYDQHLRVERDFHYIRTPYRLYYNFIHDVAASLRSVQGLSPLEDFLVRYFCEPHVVMLDELAAPVHNTTAIRNIYLKHHAFQIARNGTHYALTAGTWMPQGNISALGPGPYIGFLIGGRRNNWTIDFNFSVNFPFQRSRPFMVSYRDSLIPSDLYLGMNGAIDVNYTFLHIKKSELDVLGSVAVQGLQVLDKPNTDIINKISPSPGIGLKYKFYIKYRVKYTNHQIQHYHTNSSCLGYYDVRHSYISIKAKYDMLFFNNDLGTSLSGNAFSLGIVYGGTSKKRHYNDTRVSRRQL